MVFEFARSQFSLSTESTHEDDVTTATARRRCRRAAALLRSVFYQVVVELESCSDITQPEKPQFHSHVNFRIFLRFWLVSVLLARKCDHLWLYLIDGKQIVKSLILVWNVIDWRFLGKCTAISMSGPAGGRAKNTNSTAEQNLSSPPSLSRSSSTGLSSELDSAVATPRHASPQSVPPRSHDEEREAARARRSVVLRWSGLCRRRMHHPSSRLAQSASPGKQTSKTKCVI